MKHAIKRAFVVFIIILTVLGTVGILSVAAESASDLASDTPAHTTFDTALPLTADPVSEHMEKNTDERWYSITVNGAGDAVIVIQSHMSSGEYSENWRAQVFEADGETPLGKEFTIKGGTNTKSYTLHPTEPTTYYLCIRGLEKANLFDAGDYTVSVVTALAGTEVDYEGADGIAPVGESGVMTVSESGTEFLRLGGTSFIKLHDEEAFVALYRNSSGAVVPLVFGRTPESVEFAVSSTGEVVRAMTTTYDGFYWSYSDGINAYTDEEIPTDGLPLYFSGKSNYQHDEKLRDDIIKQIEVAEYGAVGRFFIYYWYWIVLAVIAIAVVVFCCMLKGGHGGGSESHGGLGELLGNMTGDEC